MKTFTIILVYILQTFGLPSIAQESKTESRADHYIIKTAAIKDYALIYDSTDLELKPTRNPGDKDQLLIKAYTALPKIFTSNFVITADGQSYEGTKKGIVMWDNSAYINISTENSHLPEDHITTLALDLEENLWIGTYSSGVVKGIGDPVKPFKIRPIQTREPYIQSIYADEYGFVWIFFRNGGFECFRNGSSYVYFPQPVKKYSDIETRY